MKIVLLLILVFGLVGCGKKRNKKLANTYYKMAVLELSGVESDRQKYREALRYVDMSLVEDSIPEYEAFKAVLLFKLNEFSRSRKIFEKLVFSNLSPILKSDVRNNYACLLAHIGEVEEALRIWRELEACSDYLTPEVALFNQGKYFLMNGDFKLSKEKLISAVEISPSYVDAHYYLAIVAKEGGDKDLFINEINTVLFLEPHHFGARKLSNQDM